MTHDNKKDQASERPHGHRDRGVSTDQSSKKAHIKNNKTPSGSAHDPEAAGYEADKTFEPDRDGSTS